MGRLFGTNGVRGVFGRDFTLGLVHDLTSSLAMHIGREGPVLVGYDGRTSSPLVARAVCATLNAHGVDCSNAGLVPTPCLEFATRELGYAAGVMVTASHNPPEYNGIKPCAGDGVELSRDDEAAIEEIYFARSWPDYQEPFGNTCQERGAISTYLDGIMTHIDADKIREAGLTVVLDLGNGAQAAAAPEFCRRLGCSVITINEDIDGRFPGRGSEPTPQNLSGLSEAVRKNDADLGIAFDGDGDRSMFCDDKGRILTGDVSALLLARHILQRNPDSVVVTGLNSGTAIEDMAKEYDSTVVRTKVGSVEISRHMVSTGAIIGFEENGGFMYGRHNPVRDGVMTLALMLDLLTSQPLPGAGISDLVSTLPASFTAKDKIQCTPEQARELVSYLKAASPGADTTDGIKIRMGPKEWVMVRPSGTEPIVRVYAEAASQEGLDRLIGEHTSKIRGFLATE